MGGDWSGNGLLTLSLGAVMTVQEFASELCQDEGLKVQVSRGNMLEINKIINRKLEPVLGKNGYYKAIKQVSRTRSKKPVR